MPNASQDASQWWVNDATPDNPYGKSDDYDAFLDYLGALGRSLTPAIASGTLRINVTELNDHPDYKAAVIGALDSWSATTPLKFEIVDDTPFNAETDWIEVVSPEVGEQDDGTAYSANRYVNIGQRFHDTEPDKTEVGGYVFDSFIHEFGHEFGLNHPGLYNYSGPGGVQINYLNNATWVYDRQQYSIMSYFDGIDVGEDTRWSASTPLMADTEAVIRRFFSTVDSQGVRTYQTIDLNTGDDVYGFGSDKLSYTLTSTGATHDIGFLIHDTGGDDTIDFSGSTKGTILDLRAGQFSSVNGHSNNVSIFAGHNADETEYYIERGIGSAFADVLIGNDGDNVLDGRAGGDSMAGNGGDDTYFIDSADDIVRELADGGNDTVIILNSDLDITEIENVETIIYADGTAVTPPPTSGPVAPDPTGEGELVYGTAAADEIDGGAGTQTIFGLAGDDLLVGGRDTLASRDINNTIDIEDLEDQTETDDGADALYGGEGDDTIIGGAGDDLLDGGSGDDVLKGQAGVDAFRGGAGSDTVDYSAESPFQLIVNLEQNFANGGTASGDTFDSIENLIGSDDRIDRFIGNAAANHFIGQGGGDYFNGRDGDDLLDGGADGDILFGEGGNDTLIGGGGQDALDGGDGIDTADYSRSVDAVSLSLLTGTGYGGDADGPAQIVGRGTVIRHDLLSNIENLTGSRYDDRLAGNAGVNVLVGGTGDDTLTGGGSADVLRGGLGSDTADYSDFKRGVTLNLANSNPGGDTYDSIENLSGSGFQDFITGDAGANILTGFGGTDRMNGGAGDDTLLGDFDSQVVSIAEPGRGTGYATLGAGATNNSIATAFDISNNFSLTEDPDIYDSTTVLHSTVDATGNGRAGFYKVDLAAGAIVTVDIDGIADPDVHDSWVRLLDADGNIVAQNDDGGGDPGSASGRDSSLVFVVQESGSYYVQEGRWDPEGAGDGWSAVVPEGSTYTLNVSVDSPSIAAPPGSAGSDTLVGGAGSDLLDGGGLNDRLFGGAGEDSFRFSTALGGRNIDSIRDFTVGEDQFILDSSVFDGLPDGEVLSFAAFYGSSTGVAHDASDRIIYDSDSGYLTFDADGTGSTAAIRFAQVSTGLALSADDFVII